MISGTGYAKHEAIICLDQYLDSFESSLTPCNYKIGTIKTYRGLIRRLGSIMQERGIQHERVSCTSRALFVTERAPHKPFKDGQILNSILRESFAATGLKPPCPYGGSHVLRHSLATNMVRIVCIEKQGCACGARSASTACGSRRH
jgi:hypothetical protein